MDRRVQALTVAAERYVEAVDTDLEEVGEFILRQAALAYVQQKEAGAPQAPRRGVLTAVVERRGREQEFSVDIESPETGANGMVRVRLIKIHAPRRIAQRLREYIPEWIDSNEYDIQWIDS